MKRVSVQDTDTAKLLKLARMINDMRSSHRLYSASIAKGVKCEDLLKRCERLAAEVDGMVDEVLFFTSPRLFDQSSGLPD